MFWSKQEKSKLDKVYKSDSFNYLYYCILYQLVSQAVIRGIAEENCS